MENGLEAVFTLGNGVFVAGSNPAGGTFSFPLLLAFLLVGGGFYVLAIAVFYSDLRRFTAVHVVGLSWDCMAVLVLEGIGSRPSKLCSSSQTDTTACVVLQEVYY